MEHRWLVPAQREQVLPEWAGPEPGREHQGGGQAADPLHPEQDQLHPEWGHWEARREAAECQPLEVWAGENNQGYGKYFQ